MDLRENLKEHQERLWIIGLTADSYAKPLPPMADLIDWYLNFMVAKAILKKKISLEFGDKTLIGTTGLIPALKVIVLGLGKQADFSTTSHASTQAGQAVGQAKILAQNIDQTVKDLGEETPWIIIPQLPSDSFTSALQKSLTQMPTVATSKMTVS